MSKAFIHKFGEITIIRFNHLLGGVTAAELTIDGLHYHGKGATVREAVMDLAAKIDNWQPSLNGAQTRLTLTQNAGEYPAYAKYMSLWQKLSNMGEILTNHKTGLTQKIITVLPSGYAVLENTYGVEPQRKAPAVPPAPAPEPEPEPEPEPTPDPEPELCSVCGRPVDDCGGAYQIAVDDHTCRNDRRALPRGMRF